MKPSILITLILALFSTSIWALTDYTDPTPQAAPQIPSKSKSRPVETVQSTNRSYDLRKASVDMGTRWALLQIESVNPNKSVSMYSIYSSFKTIYGITLDALYWASEQNSLNSSRANSLQRGRGLLNLNFNWLNFNDSLGLTTLDLLGGVALKGRKETLGSTRTDSHVGLELGKGIGALRSSLGYRYLFHGKASDSGELTIGNGHHVWAMVSYSFNDSVTLGAEYRGYQIGKGKDGFRLENNANFSNIESKAQMKVAESTSLILAHSFIVSRVDQSVRTDLLQAKIWEYEGAYGSTTSLTLNIGF